MPSLHVAVAVPLSFAGVGERGGAVRDGPGEGTESGGVVGAGRDGEGTEGGGVVGAGCDEGTEAAAP